MKRSPLKRKTELQRSGPLKNQYARPNKRHTKRKDSDYTKELREYIAERDVYCRVCGGRGDQVHHTVPRGRYRVHPEWYTLTHVHDERNLMWICWKCHDWAHASEENLQKAIRLQEQRFGPLRLVIGSEVEAVAK